MQILKFRYGSYLGNYQEFTSSNKTYPQDATYVYLIKTIHASTCLACCTNECIKKLQTNKLLAYSRTRYFTFINVGKLNDHILLDNTMPSWSTCYLPRCKCPTWLRLDILCLLETQTNNETTLHTQPKPSR